MANDPLRYSDEELEEFRVLIENKIAKAQEELKITQSQINDLNENAFNQQGGDIFDSTGSHSDLEFLQNLVARQQRHIQDLNNALLRIKNKTYGICTVTGQLIDKARLRAVPHATKSVDGKKQANSNPRSYAPELSKSDPFLVEEDGRSLNKPIGDQVRGLPIGKRHEDGDWTNESDLMEDAGYNKPIDDDDV